MQYSVFGRKKVNNSQSHKPDPPWRRPGADSVPDFHKLSTISDPSLQEAFCR